MTENEKPITRDYKTDNNVPCIVTGNLSAAPKLQTEFLTASNKNRKTN